jgi:hypothetical protein
VRRLLAISTVWLVFVAIACGSNSNDGNNTAATSTPILYSPTIVPAQFTTEVTNQYFPLKPGTVFTYAGTEDGVSQGNVVTVTHDTKVVDGVTCVVVHDVVTENDEVIEDTFDWYAQDAAGNVWYFGEDTKTFEKGTPTGTKGSWEAGVNGAQPGIVMEVSPKNGDSYRQEYLAGEAEDQARVAELGNARSVPAGSYQNVLSTIEYSALEPDQLEQKDYAPGVGFIYGVLTRGGNEEVKLVTVTTE